MMRSLISIALLLGLIFLIGEAVQYGVAEDKASKTVAAKEQDRSSPDDRDSGSYSQTPRKKRVLAKGAVQRAGATKSVTTGKNRSLADSLANDIKSLFQEDNAGTDDTSKKEGSEPEVKVTEQETPNPADVPKSAETSDEKTFSSSLPRASSPVLRETPFKGSLPENAGPPANVPSKDSNESNLADVPLKPIDGKNLPTLSNPSASSPLTAEMEFLRSRVRHCLQIYFQEPMSTVEYSPWGIMHVLIGFGVDSEVYAGDRKVNAIGWLCYNGPGRGMQMMHVEKGKLRVRLGPGYQGHAGQFMAMLAQSRVKKDFPIRVDGKDFTVEDLVEMEKDTCRTKTELTFKLIGLTHYLDLDAAWKNDLGEEWDIPRLIREELAQPIVGAACGGTHRMTGFSYAVNKRQKSGQAFDGQWLRAKKFVEAYHEFIFRLQNPDGSFSTKWFEGREDFGEMDRRLQTTGHMLEWLVCSLPDDKLDDSRVVNAVQYLTGIMERGARMRKKWEIGPRGHAVHALALYNERRFGDKPGDRDEVLAKGALSPVRVGTKKPTSR